MLPQIFIIIPFQKCIFSCFEVTILLIKLRAYIDEQAKSFVYPYIFVPDHLYVWHSRPRGAQFTKDHDDAHYKWKIY